MKPVIELTYTSVAADSVGSEEMLQIIELSVKNNIRDDLTGFLIFADNRFFQLIEGTESAIDNLLSKLRDDKRHSDIEILNRRAVEGRTFPKWKMKRVIPSAKFHGFPLDIPGFEKLSMHPRRAVAEFLKPAGLSSAAS